MTTEAVPLPESVRVMSPEQIGAMSTLQLAQAQKQQAFEARRDALDFDDPMIAELAAGTVGKKEPDEEPAVKPDKKASSAPDRQAKADTFTPLLLYRAHQHGLSETDARAYGEPAHLERTLTLLDRQRAAQPAPQQRQQQEPEQDQGFDLGELPDPSDGSAWDPAIVNWTKQTRTAFQQQQALIRQQQQALQQMQQSVTEHTTAQKAAVFDGKVNAFDGELAAIYGKGTAKTLPPTSPHYAARRILQNTAQALVENAGMAPEDAIAAAVNVLHPGLAKASGALDGSREELEERARDASGRFLSKPTARKDSALSSLTDGDTPPEDPKRQDAWRQKRFRQRYSAAFGED